MHGQVFSSRYLTCQGHSTARFAASPALAAGCPSAPFPAIWPGVLLEARAIRADRLTRDLRLTHLGLLALLQSQTANQVPTLARLAEGHGTAFVAMTLDLDLDLDLDLERDR